MPTNISWTQETWNPWYGCKRVSPGCLNCYADRDMTRYGKDFSTVTRSSKAVFEKPFKFKEPTLIFTCSWSDFFIHDADEWREEAWEIIKATPQHTYQILTKRPGLMVAWAEKHGWPDNAWAGTSVESQKYAPRLDVLARVPAKVRFVSYEPALGPLDLRPWVGCERCGREEDSDAHNIDGHTYTPSIIHWVIAGGESGPGARPAHPDWFRSARDQCQAAGVPFFFKQISGPRPGMNPYLDGVQHHDIPTVGARGPVGAEEERWRTYRQSGSLGRP